MQFRVLPALISCFVALAIVPPAPANVMQFTPVLDSTLYEDPEGDIGNGSGTALFMGRIGFNSNPPSLLRRALVRFDVSAIPAEAIIDNVEVRFEIVQVPPPQDANGGFATLHRVLAEWGEGDSDPPGQVEGQGTAAQSQDATWQHRSYDTELWDVAGGDFAVEESASAEYGTDLETLIFSSTPDLERDVRKWVKHPAENFGWILLGNEGQDYSARRMDSREVVVGNPPLLTVDYHIPGPADTLALELLTDEPVRPVVITNAGDGSQRLFIVEQAGLIRIYDLATDTLLATPFLDISSKVDSSGDEQGLLGLAFHPDYETNGRFYVNYTYDPGPGLDRTRVAMFQASQGNPNIANTTETVILEFEQDFSNHNGGDLHFDPQGFLVISSGDGGSGNDPNNRAQSLDTLLGKLLRIDVDSARRAEGSEGLCGLVQNYAIPPGNPYAGPDEGCDEILHYGLRNPWRFSYDARTGELFIGDVGQGLWEEVSYAAPGATDINYGWKICEGAHLRGEIDEPCTFGTLPIIEYSSASGGNCSITGGYVYRGGSQALHGRYLYADYCSARIWIATFNGDTWESEEWIESPALGSVSTFGQDQQCELYVADFGSIFTDGDERIYRIIDTEYLHSAGFEELRCR